MDNSVELIWAFLINHEKNWGVLSHKHDYFQMFYCLSGRGTVLMEQQTYILEKNSCVLIWPQQIHEVLPVDNGHFRIIDTAFYIHDESIKNAVYEVAQYYPLADPRFRDIQKNMQNEWDSETLFSKEIAKLLFTYSLFLLVRSSAPIIEFPDFSTIDGISAPASPYHSLSSLPQNLDGTEKKIVDYLSAHYLEDLTLDKIAKDLHYSNNYISKAFTRATGYPIKQYVNYLRINKAYDLVCHTDTSFSEIASLCGFSSIHYFSKVFHRILGLTPTQARNRSSSADLLLYGPRRYRYCKTADINDSFDTSPQ